MTAQCGQAPASVHAIDRGPVTGLSACDPPADRKGLPPLDALGEVRPALDLGVRWLNAHRPPSGPQVIVHGDFRLGNLMIGLHGLSAVLDRELAHVGDPAEDIGWLCAPASPLGGVGRVEELLDAYHAAGGPYVGTEEVAWWEAFATAKWALLCGLQESPHLKWEHPFGGPRYWRWSKR
ncbi:MAG: phosphotransferase [Acidimicrobiales bacterium]